MKKTFYSALVLFSALVFGCGRETSAQPETGSPTVTVVIRTMQFSPATIEVKKGDVVAWKNEDIVPHTATASSFDSGSIAPGHSWQHTFTEQATVTYACAFHPTMKGAVTVK
jgi:plastocyanin